MVAACGLLNGGKDHNILGGTIVFSAPDTAGTYQLFTMRADGSQLRQLTFLEPHEGAFSPAWSPDGQTIAFTSFKMGSTAGTALWLMDAGGGKLRPVFRDPEAPWALLGSHPAWSPDGTQLAFDHCINCEAFGRNREIFVVDLATDSVRRLTGHPAGDTYPTWSPDGNKVAFSSNRDYVDADTMRYRKDLYVLNIDGTGMQRLTNSGNVDIPSWQPSGSLIAYAWQHKDSEIFLFDQTDNEIRQLTALKYVGRPRWSKDGLHLLISGTTENNNFVFQYVNTSGKILEEIPRKIEDMKESDWFSK